MNLVNIVMLGDSGAGKTTYVSLMYAEMHDGVAGFQVRANDAEHHRQLLRDARGIRAGRYPAATHQRASYDLTLRYADADVLPFSWRDHRGGAASGRSTDASDVAELHQDLLDSDAIVIFLDGSVLAHQPRAARPVGRLTGHVLRALRNRQEVLTPIVIAITKCDLIDLEDERVTEALLAPLQQLVEAVAGTQHVHGTVLPISCGPQPLNVVVPVLWSLRFGLVGMTMRLAMTVQELDGIAKAAAAKDTIGDRIGSWFRNEPTWAKISTDHRIAAELAYLEMEELMPAAESISTLLEDIDSF